MLLNGTSKRLLDLFFAFRFLTGIPWQDAVQSGSVMATKLLSNEFVAMQDLGKATGLSEHAKGITSVFLVSFANFSSIGIISGAIKSLNDEKVTLLLVRNKIIIWCNTCFVYISGYCRILHLITYVDLSKSNVLFLLLLF